MSRRLKDTLPLGVFIKRQQVLRLFRAMQKAARDVADKNLSVDLRVQIREEFKKSKQVKDPMATKSLIQEANRHLTKLKSMSSSGLSSDKLALNSWAQSSSDPEDEKGRVGTEFPWER